MTATTGTIRAIDRDRNGKYDLDLQCLWSIVAPDDSRVQLKFLSMDIEDSFYCLFDAVVVETEFYNCLLSYSIVEKLQELFFSKFMLKRYKIC